ncbi:MAG: hypothetical protein M3533_14345 [Actinomycetota bacterium]|nr:hypothetical protein [Actinomycetota bacterium]
MKPQELSRQLRERDTRIPPTLAGKAAFDTARADKLGVDWRKEHRAFCFWCLLAAGSTFATVSLVMSEARAALRQFAA